MVQHRGWRYASFDYLKDISLLGVVGTLEYYSEANYPTELKAVPCRGFFQR